MTDTSGPLVDMEGPTSDPGGPLADSRGPLVDAESLWWRGRQEALWTAQGSLLPTQIALARCGRSYSNTGDQLTDKQRADPLTDI